MQKFSLPLHSSVFTVHSSQQHIQILPLQSSQQHIQILPQRYLLCLNILSLHCLFGAYEAYMFEQRWWLPSPTLPHTQYLWFYHFIGLPIGPFCSYNLLPYSF
ncbi:hypothetical protein PS1_040221 [Malus domestica]